MDRQHHRLSGHEPEQTLGDGEGQGSLACYSPRGCSQTRLSDRTTTSHLVRMDFSKHASQEFLKITLKKKKKKKNFTK